MLLRVHNFDLCHQLSQHNYFIAEFYSKTRIIFLWGTKFTELGFLRGSDGGGFLAAGGGFLETSGDGLQVQLPLQVPLKLCQVLEVSATRLAEQVLRFRLVLLVPMPS